MGGGLKEQWGVDDPVEAGSDEQSQEFNAAFEKEMDEVNEHLQFTTANGEAARHGPLASRRDAMIPAYQKALGEIDPEDADAAKGAIDQVLADAKALKDEVASFRRETEKALADWQSREAAFDAGVREVEELESWTHPEAGALRTQADGVRTQVNGRAYAKAVATLDQLLPKVKPIYEEYLRQEEAQQRYEPVVAALEPRLDAAAQSKFAKLAPMQSDLSAVKSQMADAAQGRDFVTALANATDLTAKVDAHAAALAELERQKAAYEQALATAKPKLDAASRLPRHAKLDAMRSEIESGRPQMEQAALAEEYERALQAVNDLGTKVDTYTTAVEEIERQKAEYERAFATLRPRIDGLSEKRPKTPAAQFEEIGLVSTQMQGAAAAEEYGQALERLTDATSKVEAYEAAVAEIDRQQKAYEAAHGELWLRIRKTFGLPGGEAKPQPPEILSLIGKMEESAGAEDFEQALARVKDISAVLDAIDAEDAKEMDGPPKVTGVDPASCPAKGGTKVTITGVRFTGTQGVSFDGISADFRVESDTRITATTPDVSKHFSPGSDLRVIVTTGEGANPGPSGPSVRFGEATQDVPSTPGPGSPDEVPVGAASGASGPSREEEDNKALDSLKTEQPTREDREKQTDEAYKNAFKKVAEASLEEFLKTKQGKKLKKALEDAVDKIPDPVKYGVPAAAIVAALATLAVKHEESPITQTPDIPLKIGPIRVTAKITWEGPVDKPTKTGAMFTFDIPLGPADEKKKDDGVSELAKETERLRRDLEKRTPKEKDEPPPISGDPLPPLPTTTSGTPVLVENFDVSKGKGKKAWNPDKLAKEIGTHSDGTKGRIQVVAYWEAVDGDTDAGRKRNGENLDQATDNAATTKKALANWLHKNWKKRIDTAVEIRTEGGGGRTFGLSGSDAAALGTHEVAVIYVP